jgi:hypothetical protein
MLRSPNNTASANTPTSFLFMPCVRYIQQVHNLFHVLDVLARIVAMAADGTLPGVVMPVKHALLQLLNTTGQDWRCKVVHTLLRSLCEQLA